MEAEGWATGEEVLGGAVEEEAGVGLETAVVGWDVKVGGKDLVDEVAAGTAMVMDAAGVGMGTAAAAGAEEARAAAAAAPLC